MNQYEKLTIWQDSVDLSVEIYEITKQFPKEELFGLTSQMRRSAISIPSNIGEGSCRDNPGEFRHFLGMASGSAGELNTQIQISAKLKLMTEMEQKDLKQKIDSIQKRNYNLQLKLQGDIASAKTKKTI